MQRDYYEVLGVQRGCDESALKSAFYKLAKQHHPDRNDGCEEAAGRFKEINEAYSILSDADKRAAYDRFGHAGVNGHGGAGFADVHDIFNEVFGDMFGRGQRRPQGPSRGGDLRYDLEISLEQAYAGADVSITVPAALTCEACAGTGCAPGSSPTACTGCNGQGRVRASQGFFTIERTCPTCQGSGRVIRDPCRTCHGNGRVAREKTLSVSIPPGVEDGTRIRLAGEGEAGMRGGGSGDLYIFLRVKPHRLFQREGANIHLRVPIALPVAALGGSLEVPTIDGNRTRLTIPPGTQSGHQLRLKGKGMSVLRSGSRGDMFVEVAVEIPVNLSKRQQELLKEFEAAGDARKTQPQSAGFFAKVKEFFGDLRE